MVHHLTCLQRANIRPISVETSATIQLEDGTTEELDYGITLGLLAAVNAKTKILSPPNGRLPRDIMSVSCSQWTENAVGLYLEATYEARTRRKLPWNPPRVVSVVSLVAITGQGKTTDQLQEVTVMLTKPLPCNDPPVQLTLWAVVFFRVTTVKKRWRSIGDSVVIRTRWRWTRCLKRLLIKSNFMHPGHEALFRKPVGHLEN